MATIWTLLLDGIKSLIDIVTLDQLHEAIMILWEIWNARNNLAARFWQDWTKARIPTSSFITIEPDFATKWFPPGENIFKCNIDGSWDLASGIILVQDSHGSFIRVRSSRLGRQYDSLMAESLGVREALSWLKEHFAATPIIVEMDNLLVKQALISKPVCPPVSSGFGLYDGCYVVDNRSPSLIHDVVNFDLINN
ncbi:hypothetical protein KY289_004434 [Solanum tuberosum]|nr:hypothetical protein KY289_004434 [Solanum tuberosum]